MADNEQDAWEQAAKTYKGGTTPGSTSPQASSSDDPWENASKTFKAAPSAQGTEDTGLLATANKAYEGPGVGNALGRLGVAIPNMVSQAYHAFADKRTPDEEKLDKTPVLGDVALAAKRVILDPSQQSYEHIEQEARANDAALRAQGKEPGVKEKLAEAGGKALSMVPMAGPFGIQLGERAGKGDVSGALTEGAGYALAPEVLHEAMPGGALPGAAEAGARPFPTVDSAVRAVGKATKFAGENAPSAGAAIGGVSGGLAGGAGGAAYGTYTGGRVGKIVGGPLEAVGNKLSKVGMTPDEKAISAHEDLAKKADKAVAKAEEAHSIYKASEAKGPIDPDANPAYKKSLDALEKARTAQAEAHYHLQEAKEAARVAAAPKATEAPDRPITAEEAAAARPEETTPTKEENDAKLSGLMDQVAPEKPSTAPPTVSPAHATDTFPQEPTEAPAQATGMRQLPGGEPMGRQLALPAPREAEGVPEAAPESPKTPMGEVLLPEKPAKPGRLGTLRAQGGQVVDTEPEIQQKIEEGLQGTAKPVALKPLGAPESAPLGKIPEAASKEAADAYEEHQDKEAESESEAIARKQRDDEVKAAAEKKAEAPKEDLKTQQARWDEEKDAAFDEKLAKMKAAKQANEAGPAAEAPKEDLKTMQARWDAESDDAFDEKLARMKANEAPERSPEDASKVDKWLHDHTDQELLRRATKMGLDESKYDLSKRGDDVHRHRVDRDQLKKDMAAKISDEDIDKIAKLSDNFDSKDESTWSQAERNGMSRAQRARAISQEFDGGPKAESSKAVSSIPKERLEVGDTFVDETGEPRRVTGIEGDKIRTADGTLRTYDGTVKAQGDLNSPKAKLAQGGKFHPVDEPEENKQGGHAGGGAASEEEIARPGKNYIVSKSGQLTYHGKSFAPEETPRGSAHVTVLPDGTIRTNEGTMTPAMKAAVRKGSEGAIEKQRLQPPAGGEARASRLDEIAKAEAERQANRKDVPTSKNTKSSDVYTDADGNKWFRSGKSDAEMEKAHPVKQEVLPPEAKPTDKVTLHHYSTTEGITETDPEKMGTGKPGAEQARAKDPGFLPRTHLGDETYKEKGVTTLPNHYTTEVNRSDYYDIAKDPEGIWQEALKKGNHTDAENAVHDAGYHGYTHNGGYISFEKLPVKPFEGPNVGGTEAGAKQDTDHFAQAKKELPNGTLSEQAMRAQELKDKAAEGASNISAQIEAHKANGGSTFHPEHGDLNGKPFFSVGGEPEFQAPELKMTTKGGELTAEQLKEFSERPAVKEALAKHPDASVGTWHDKEADNTVTELVKTPADREEAIAMGKRNNQKAIYDLANGKDIPTGGTGETERNLPKGYPKTDEEAEAKITKEGGVGGGTASAAPKMAKEPEALPELAEKHLTPEEREGVSKTKAQQDKFVQRMTEMPELREWVDAAERGAGERKWYQRSSQAIEAMTKEAPNYFGEEGDREKFTGLLASGSPQQAVVNNMREALRVWTSYVDAGRPEGAALEKLLRKPMAEGGFTIPNAKVGNTMKALAGEPMWPDITKNQNFKVPSFRGNLVGMLQRVTNDGWMALFSGMKGEDISSAHSYHPMSVMVRAAAEELGWEPAEAQAAIWAFIKTLVDQGKEQSETPSMMREHSEDFADIIKYDQQTRGLLKEMGVNHAELDKRLEGVEPKPEPKVSSGESATAEDSARRASERVTKLRGQGAIPAPKSGDLFRELRAAEEERGRRVSESPEAVSFDPEKFKTQAGEDTKLKPLGKKKSPLGSAKR